jgi:predicted nucleic-acid-binding Zn-ribbon protein
MSDAKKSCPKCGSPMEEYESLVLTLETPVIDFPSNRQHGLLVTMCVCSGCGFLEFYRTK